MRSSRQHHRRDQGAVAVLVAIIVAFALVPAIALGTSTYVRTTTGAELQRASDTGALAGASEIPLGNLTFVGDYLNQITGTQLPGTTLSQLGLTDPSLPDPLTDACAAAKHDAENHNNLAYSYANTNDDSAVTCSASYLTNDSAVADLQNCVNSASLGLLNGLSGLLGGLGGLNPNQILAGLAPALPALLEPGVKVTMSWKVQSPFDQIFSSTSGGKTQTTTSYARRRFKNMVVIPTATLPGGTTINVNPALQNARTLVLNTMSSIESLVSKIPLISSCANVLSDLQGDIADAVDPPSNGPSLNSILSDAVTSNEPILAAVIPQTLGALSIPFLDIVPVCMTQVNGQYVAHLTSFGSCLIGAEGGFRASLRNS